MSFRGLLALLFLLLALVVCALLLSNRLLFGALTTLVASTSDYQLELTDPKLDWLPFHFESRLVLVTPDAEGAAPLFALQNFEMSASLQDWLLGTNSGHLHISNLSLFIDETAPGGRPDASTLLRPLSLFPTRVEIDTMHLIDRRQDVWIFPLIDLTARRIEDGGINVSATAGTPERPLSLETILTPETAAGRVVGVDIAAAVLGVDNTNALTLLGTVDAVEDNLHYRMQLNGAYAQVGDFLRALDEEAVFLEGRLEVAGELIGNLDELQLSVEHLLVDNAPAYGFSADGAVTQVGAESPRLNLNLHGTMSGTDSLPGVPERYRSLLVDSELTVHASGTLADPIVDTVSVSAETSSGLAFSATAAGLSANPADVETVLEDSPLLLLLRGSNSEAITPLLEDPLPPFGAWTITGRLSGTSERYRLDDVRGSVALDSTAYVQMEGRIDTIRPDVEANTAALEGIVLNAALASDQAVSTTSIGIDSPLAVEALSMRLEGVIADAAALAGVMLNAELQTLTLTQAGEDEINDTDKGWPQLPINLRGKSRISRALDRWQVSQLELSGNLDDGSELAASGALSLSGSTVGGDLNLDLASSPGDALNWPGPFQLEANRITAQVRLRETYATILGTLETPHEPLQWVLSADVEDGTPTHLSLDVYTTSLDVGDLSYQFHAEDVQSPDVQEDAEESAAFTLPPLHVTLRADDIHGTSTALDSLVVSIEGENDQYLLRQLDMDYATGLLRLRGLLDLSSEEPQASLAGEGFRVPLAALARDLDIQESFSGELSLRGGVAARGENIHSLLTSMNGRLALAISDAEVSGPAYDLLMSNLLAWVAVGASETTTRFNCAMAQFDVVDGVARTDSIYIESPRMLATGKARIDLVEDQVEARIEPRSRTRTIQFPSDVKITGPLSQPKVSVSALQATGDAAAQALLLLPSLTLKLFGIGADNEISPPCQAQLP